MTPVADVYTLQAMMEHVHNWFPHNFATGDFSVKDGSLEQGHPFLQEGQYFRIVGSVFNDGLHVYPATDLHDEDFEGEVWGLAVPQSFVDLADDVFDFVSKNPVNDSLTSESFGGYSYTKGTSPVTGVAAGWQDVFKSRLNAFRRLP